MNNPKSIITILFAALAVFQSIAQDGEGPYFLIKNSKAATLPLEDNKAEVYISGIIADVTLSQIYRNNSDSIIEAIYVFPGSTQAAVYDMEMQIGDRIIKAELKEKQEARKVYENAKKAGKRTSLLEQHRPNVFQMNVANIMPGERIIVRLKYTEKILPFHGNYQFVLPTVVGPRYHESSSSNPVTFVSMPYTKEGEKAKYTYDIDVYINGGSPIQKISSNSHQIEVTKFNASIAHVEINQGELYSGNKDFTLTYRLASNQIESGLLLYEGEEENFFFANIQPPNILSDDLLPAKEYIFIVDISGSMHGFPLEVSKKLMRDLLSALKPSDRFNVMLFAGTSYMFSQVSLYASKENIDVVLENLDKKRGSGSTQLLPALKKAIETPLLGNGMSRSLVLLTDGYISVEKEAFELIRANLDRANVFTFGIGSSTNRFLIEGLANVGQGIPFVVEKAATACEVSERFKEYISKPSLTNISIDYEGFDAYDVEPKSIPDLMAERPINIIGKWKKSPKGKINVRGYLGNKEYQYAIDLADYRPDSKNKALSLLWARERIRILDDYRKILYNEDHKQEMIDLSLKYNLLSAYTSFVAVDYEKAYEGKRVIKKVKQALPLPAGVSNSAIGAELEIKKSQKRKKGNYLIIGEIKGGISDAKLLELKKLMTMKIRSLKACLANPSQQSLLITLKFDQDGLLVSVQFDQTLDDETAECLTDELSSIDFSTLNISNTTIYIPIQTIK